MTPVSLLDLQLFPQRTAMFLCRSWKLTPAGSRRARLLLARSGGETVEPFRHEPDEAVGELLGEGVDELLKRKENRSLLEGLEKASRRVELARAALADIERQEAEALRTKELVLQLQSREFEVTETQKELLKVRAMVEESEESLSFKNSNFSHNEVIRVEIERLESIKAASISSLAGTLASLPLSLYQATSLTALALHTSIFFISTALFGITFRYTVRGDVDNFQLKTGTVAAFGFVKGLAKLEAGTPLELSTDSFVRYFIGGAVSVSENIFVFLAAAVALDFCFKLKLLSTFPIKSEDQV